MCPEPDVRYVLPPRPSNDDDSNASQRIDIEREFAIAFEQHRNAVFQAARRIVGEQLAHDVTQETFLRFWLAPDRYDPARGSLRAMLTTIAHHAAIDMLRTQSARRTREARVGGNAAQDTNGWDDTGLMDVSPSRIAAALAALRPEQRQAVLLVLQGDLTYRAAADQLGIPEGTFKSRVRLGFRRLRGTLK